MVANGKAAQRNRPDKLLANIAAEPSISAHIREYNGFALPHVLASTTTLKRKRLTELQDGGLTIGKQNLTYYNKLDAVNVLDAAGKKNLQF